MTARAERARQRLEEARGLTWDQAVEHPEGAYLSQRSAAIAAAEAQKMMARMRKIDPELRVSNLKNVIGFFGSDDLARYSEGLRKAGLPE